MFVGILYLVGTAAGVLSLVFTGSLRADDYLTIVSGEAARVKVGVLFVLVMGLALTIGTISEIPILIFVNRFIKRYKAYALLIFSIAMTGLRFLLLSIAPNPTFVLFVQLLNGFNFPLLTVAAVTYADELALPGFRATAQGLYNAASGGLGSAVGGFVGGVDIENVSKGDIESFDKVQKSKASGSASNDAVGKLEELVQLAGLAQTEQSPIRKRKALAKLKEALVEFGVNPELMVDPDTPVDS